ncbi:MAG: hypothetical protein IKL65_02775 [Bacilli bacterium]|nr:hypothetical protein [Bacilli bacterium]
MNIDITKESTIEYIESIYALSISYLKNNTNIELKNLLKELELIEDKIRICDDIEVLNNYKNILNSLIYRIEGIINE